MLKRFGQRGTQEKQRSVVMGIERAGDKARLQIDMVYSETDPKTGKRTLRGEQRPMVLHCVREKGVWKAWRLLTATDDLAFALLAKRTAQERSALLAAHPELVNGRLADSLAIRGQTFANRKNYTQ